MKKIFAISAVAAAVALTTSACGPGFYDGDCLESKMGELEARADISFDEKAQASAKEHLKMARESKAKNDVPGCEAHVKQAREALQKK